MKKSFLISLMTVGMSLSAIAHAKTSEANLNPVVTTNNEVEVLEKDKENNRDFRNCSMYEERIENMNDIRSYEISLYKEILKDGKWRADFIQKMATMPANVKLKDIVDDSVVTRKVYVTQVDNQQSYQTQTTTTNFVEAVLYDNKEGDVCFNVFLGKNINVNNQENLLLGSNSFSSNVHSVQINKVKSGKNLLVERDGEKWMLEIKQLYVK